ncbi:MAG: hypothetical protein ABIR00_08265 [Nitrosospira sp.]
MLADFESRIVTLGKFEVTQKDRYHTLNNQINILLPAATSAGLAAAYGEMKDSFNDPIKQISRIFYFSIAAFFLLSSVIAVLESGFKPDDWNGVLRGLIYKLPFYVPLVWLVFYASKRRSEYQRLQQEYAHKEALAKSYDSYKKQLEGLDGDNMEMQKALIAEAVNAIAYNASATLDGKQETKCLHKASLPQSSKRLRLTGKVIEWTPTLPNGI